MIFGLTVAILLGLILGSFASAIAWRVPRGVSWVRARSACPSCKTHLGFPDLVPVFSWLVLRGRCRHCGQAIGMHYPMLELLTLCLCIGTYFVFGLTAPGLIVMAAMPFLVAMIAIDFEHYILPDHLNLILWALGLAFVLATNAGQLLPNIMAAAVYAGLALGTGWAMRKALKKDALGLGDVKFFAVAGVWLGVSMLPAFLIFSGIAGVGIGVFWKVRDKGDLFPFGPALILSFLICLGFGAEIQAFWEGFY